MSSNKPLFINDLPDDMLCEVFDRLTVKQVVAIQTINKQFYRCFKNWIVTVDDLFIGSEFFLRKTFGKQLYWPSSGGFQKCQKTLFPSIDKMLTDVCTGIKVLRFNYCSGHSISAPKLVKLVGRCSNLNTILLSAPFCRMTFSNRDWLRLGRLIQDCDVHLFVKSNSPTADRLEQLFNVAKKIKTVRFLYPNDSILKTMALLDSSTKVEVYFREIRSPVDNEVRRLLARNVDLLGIYSDAFQTLSIDCYSKLTHLNIFGNSTKNDTLTFKFKFKQLKRLILMRYDDSQHWFKSFFSAVSRMDQLEQLELIDSDKLFVENERDTLTGMLAKTPKINELIISCCFPKNEMLIQFLAETSTRLPSTVAIRFYSKDISAGDFGRLFDLLIEFGNRKTDVQLNFNLVNVKEDVKRDVIIKNLPKNVKIIWPNQH